MKIIGHRGAAGIALGNSRESFIAAKVHNVDYIELDVRLTADDHLIVIHDATTGHVSDNKVTVRQETLAKLQRLELTNGGKLLTLDESLDIIDDTPVIIELKDSGSVHELLLVLERHPNTKFSISSFHHDELRRIRKSFPDVSIYVLEHFAPIAIIQSAHSLHAAGIGLNKWLMNPLTYRLAKHYGLEMQLYTVNSPTLAKFLLLLYPNVSFHTDQPQRFSQFKQV